jgi:TonB family protein
MKLLLSAAIVFAACSFGEAAGQRPETKYYELERKPSRQIQRLKRLQGTPEEQYVQAVRLVLEVAENDAYSPHSRSVAYELLADIEKGRAAELEHLLDAINIAPKDDYRLFRMVDRAASLLLERRKFEEALAFSDRYGAYFSPYPNDLPLYRAEAMAALGRLEEALEEIGPSNGEGDLLLKKRLRYALLVTLGRDAEARAVLDDFSTDSNYEEVLEAERARLDELTRSGADRDTRRRAGMAFSERITTTYTESEPVKRVLPRGFERCIRTAYAGSRIPDRAYSEAVQLEFDVRTDGSVTNVRVLESSNPCYDRYAVEAAEQWVYRPAIRNNERVVRTGVRTSIRFEISAS